MLRGIDISGYQNDMNPNAIDTDFMIIKATEGIDYINSSCNRFVAHCIDKKIPFGVYHFARPNDASMEAIFFFNAIKKYLGLCIPVLDFEDTKCSNLWLNKFVEKFHSLSGIYPWVYMSSSFINQLGYGSQYIKDNCGLWLAGYPDNYSYYISDTNCPYNTSGWNLVAWQFTSSLRLNGYNGNLDGNFFYGNISTWNQYVTGGSDMTNEEHDMLKKILDYTYYGGQEDNNLSWNYNWKNANGDSTAPEGNMYNCVKGIYYMVAEMKTTLAAQNAAIDALAKANGANPDDIAKMVSNSVAAKLSELKIKIEQS